VIAIAVTNSGVYIAAVLVAFFLWGMVGFALWERRMERREDED
jgi:hypothetical protein